MLQAAGGPQDRGVVTCRQDHRRHLDRLSPRRPALRRAHPTVPLPAVAAHRRTSGRFARLLHSRQVDGGTNDIHVPEEVDESLMSRERERSGEVTVRSLQMKISTFLFFLAPVTLIICLYIMIGIALRSSPLARGSSDDSSHTNIKHTALPYQPRRAVVRMLGEYSSDVSHTCALRHYFSIAHEATQTHTHQAMSVVSHPTFHPLVSSEQRRVWKVDGRTV
ncbi:hypothetical protein C0Q70_11889 [Pomacea canaliculata]|uniref:Uncharacterized protein n=1 Tax=Pomacea canaliculata TaxID=400727 RepID=A0A2T7P792_POMCA|nr:hypothetical protein C0Q70_11889 [Pomacea canaliculata]